MTEADRQLTMRAFAEGPAALLDSGLSVDAVKEFIIRPDVQAYMQTLAEELGAHESLMARTRFMARRDLARLAPQAVQILRNAMQGVVFKKDDSGKVITEKKIKGKGRAAKEVETPVVLELPPADYQVEAAQDVLDRLGVNEKATTEKGSGVSVQVLFNTVQQESVNIEYGGDMDEAQKTLVRERVRSVIEKLSGNLPEFQHRMKKLTAPSKAAVAKAKHAVKKSKRRGSAGSSYSST